MTLEDLRMAVGLHFSYGYADNSKDPSFRFRVGRFLTAFGVPLPDCASDDQASAAAQVIWDRYVKLLRQMLFTTDPQRKLVYDTQLHKSREVLYVLAVATQVDSVVPGLARELLTDAVFKPLWCAQTTT